MKEELITLSSWLVIFLLLFGACSRVQYRPVGEVRLLEHFHQTQRVDSVRVTDSIYLRIEPDTVYKYRQHTEYRYLMHTLHDTLRLTDTLRVTVEVERPLTRWQRLKLEAGGVAMSLLLLLLLFLFWRLLPQHRF